MRQQSAPDAPRLPAKMAELKLPENGLQDFDEFCKGRLTRIDLANQVAEHVTLRAVYCQSVGFAASELFSPRLDDVGMVDCDLVSANWPRTIMRRCQIESTRLIGLTATECHIQNVLFKECLAHSARFRFSSFKDVYFEGCDLSDVDFQGTDLSGTVFRKCNLSGAQLSGAKLAGTDLRSSDIEDIRVGLDELPGAIVDHFQAAYIAGLMGVVIKDEHES